MPSTSAIRETSPDTTIEILTPDFQNKEGAVEVVASAKPDVFNHNLETVPRLYTRVRPGARYFHSLRLLDEVKRIDPSIFTKSGLMVGLGESKHEVLQVMDELRAADTQAPAIALPGTITSPEGSDVADLITWTFGNIAHIAQAPSEAQRMFYAQ